jgi:hypothetical protein
VYCFQLTLKQKLQVKNLSLKHVALSTQYFPFIANDSKDHNTSSTVVKEFPLKMSCSSTSPYTRNITRHRQSQNTRKAKRLQDVTSFVLHTTKRLQDVTSFVLQDHHTSLTDDFQFVLLFNIFSKLNANNYIYLSMHLNTATLMTY